MSHELLDLSVLELAQRIRAKELSPLECLEAHIARIESVNPLIHAVVGERYELARQEAKALERKLAAAPVHDPELPPLVGVPCTAKEFWAVRGMPQTGGIVQRRESIAEEDAEVIRRIRAAGAIVVGVTNVPEGGMWLESDNRLYGRTNNPWDLGRTAGGSSGGDGAIVAAGGVPFALASDIGGSVRLPAAFCGAVGHKPTGGTVPIAGHFPAPEPELADYLAGGPIARRIEDLWAVQQVLTRATPLKSPMLQPLPDIAAQQLRVWVATSNGRQKVASNVQEVVRRSADFLQSQGAAVEELHEPRLKRSFEIWMAMMTEAQGSSYAELLGGGKSIEIWREVLKLAVGRSEHTMPAIGVAAVEQLYRRFSDRIAPVDELAQDGRALQADLEARLGDSGVLLYPAYSRTAPIHNMTMLSPLDVAYTSIFNVLEFPATVVPIDSDNDGLPVAVQVIAKRGNDALCLAVAQLLERRFGGWMRAEPSAVPKRDSMIERLRATRKG